MLNIEIDQQEVRQLMLRKIEENIKLINEELVFWDSRELERRTCMSTNTIKNTFFYEPGFPKYKIGGKWYFPARETEDFLLKWIKEKKDE